MSMQKITKLVARQIGASRAAVGRSGFKSVAVFLVPETVTPESMWDNTEVSREEYFGYVRDWVLTHTEKDYATLCDRYGLLEADQAILEYPSGVPEELLRELSEKIRKFPSDLVCSMVRERAVSCLWKPDVTFLPAFMFDKYAIALTWKAIPGTFTVWSNVFGWEVVVNFGRHQQFHFKNVNSGELDSKIENFFRFLKQIKGEEPQSLTKTTES